MEEDYSFGSEGSYAVPKQSKLSKRVSGSRRLEADVTAKSAPIKPVQSQAEVEQVVKASTQDTLEESAANANARPVLDAFTSSVGGYSRDIYEAVTRETANADLDPKWDAGAVRENFRSTYGMEFWDALENTKNKSQYDNLVQTLDEKMKTEELQSQSFVGSSLGLLLDPIGLLSGGAVLKAAQVGARAFKVGKVGALAGGALAEGSVYGGIEAATQNSEVGYVYDKESVASTMAIAGALHFGLGAAFVPKSAFDPVVSESELLINQARKELGTFSESKANELQSGKAKVVEPETRIFPPESYPAPKPDPVADEAIVDAGAAANKTRKDAVNDVIIESKSDAVNDVLETAKLEDKANKDLIGQEKFDWLNSTVGKVSAFTSNTLRGLQSKSEVVRTYALKLGADPTGIFRQIEKGTAYDKSRYSNMMRNHFSAIHDEYKSWLKRTGQGGFVAQMTGRNEIGFNRLLREEMEHRWNTKDLSPEEIKGLDEARWAKVDPEIKRAADALDRGNQVALDFMKEHNVLGAEGLSPVSRGYVSRRLSGDALRDMAAAEGKEGFNKFKDALSRRYFEAFHAMQQKLIAEIKADGALDAAMRKAELDRIKPITEDKARTIATGVIEKALDRSAKVTGTTIGVMDRAARDEIKSILESKGMDYVDLEHTFSLIDKRLGANSGSSRLKGRMDVDIATPDVKTGINFLDYFDNDLNRLTSSYAEEMSGRIALARQGISNDNDFEHVINAVKNSHKGNSEEVTKDIQLLRDMYSNMLGRPLEGQGTNKFTQFMSNLNPLQTLGQVGVAQATESSMSVARLGVGAALKAIPMFAKVLVGARKGLVSAEDAKLLKSVEAWNGPVGELWRTHRPMTDVMERLNAHGETSRMADRLMKAGQHINGFVSFMHQMMETQLKVAAIEGTRVFAKEIKAGVLSKRLADAGFDEHSMKAIKRELDAHAVYKDGELFDLQDGKWSRDNADHFMRNIERLSGQLIQRDFAGETASWMQKDMGRMLLSLRGYSVKAFNKQLVRNVQIGDAVAAMSVVNGLAFSTMGYTAKMYVMAAGREDREQFLEDRLSGDSLISGAVGYMALGSIGPELIRPLASWNAEAGEAGAIRSSGNALTAIIPGLSPLARLAQDVDNIGSSTVGDADWTSKKTRHLVQSALGNSFPVALGLNAIVDDNE